MSSYKFLDLLSVKELRDICKGVGIDNPDNISKEDLISYLRNGFRKYKLPDKDINKKEKVEGKKEEKKEIEIKEKIGHEGKEGTIYLVKKGKKELAMKKFKSGKSINNIEKEGKLLTKAAKLGVSPKVYEINIDKKYILMEKLDKSLFDILKENKGKMSIELQKRMIEICKKLDEAGIYHGDPSPLNFMVDGEGKMYIIDFGFGNIVDEKFIQKNKTNKPNMSFMILGFLLKVKDVCDLKNFKELLKTIPKDEQKKFGLI